MMKRWLKKIIPDFVFLPKRNYVMAKKKRRHHSLQRKILHSLEHLSEQDLTDEKKEVLAYLKQHPIAVLPYPFIQKYTSRKETVYRDNDRGMHYVLQDNKRLYFKRAWGEEKVQAYYNGLLMEQDAASPHRYETDNFSVAAGDVVVDAGAAEGNFALSVVERAKKIYLFEADEEWIEALQATFAPWKEKVVVVNRYVSDYDSPTHVSFDTFFGTAPVDFIKADIEGAEPLLLAGAKALLSRSASMKIVLCTYHRHRDAERLRRTLVESGFRTAFSKGYMIFFYEMYDRLRPPYLRRGLVRGVK
jgi:hypothetical protein